MKQSRNAYVEKPPKATDQRRNAISVIYTNVVLFLYTSSVSGISSNTSKKEYLFKNNSLFVKIGLGSSIDFRFAHYNFIPNMNL